MAQKKKASGKAQIKKKAITKSKSKSIAAKSIVVKKTSKSVPTSKSVTKTVKAAPKATAVKKPAKPAAAPAKAPVAKAAAPKVQAKAPVAKAPVAKAAAPKPAPPKASAPKAAPPKVAVSKAVPPPPKAMVAKPVLRAAVATAAKTTLPQVKAPTPKMPMPQVAPVAAPPRVAVPAAAAATKSAPQKVAPPATPKDIAARTAVARQQVPAVAQPAPPAAAGPKKIVSQRHGFKTNEFIVYPAHGVGRIVGIEEQEIAGMSLELFVIQFDKDKMTVRVPTGKLQSVGMRKLADDNVVTRALDTLKGRARVKRTMWSRRAQEYEAKINSGDLISIAEVVRDLYRSESQPEQSYSERQLYEAALDRMAREIAAVEKLDDRGAVQRITEVLARSARGRRLAAEGAAEAAAASVKAA